MKNNYFKTIYLNILTTL